MSDRALLESKAASPAHASYRSRSSHPPAAGVNPASGDGRHRRRGPLPVTEHDEEPVFGLPEALPEGERILWQGRPDANALALRACKVRALLLYGLAVMAFGGLQTYRSGGDPLIALFWLSLVPLAGAGLPWLYAWGVAKTTAYTVTTERLVMRFGLALPVTMNLPFKLIEAVDLREAGDKEGTGDVSVALGGPDRLAYLHLWPHARAGRLAKPQPSLRAIPDARTVGRLLARALEAHAGGTPAPEALPRRVKLPGRAGGGLAPALGLQRRAGA